MRLILMLALALPVLGVTGAASAAASSAAAGAPARVAAQAPLVLAQAADTAAELPARMEPSKPSGFWGSTRPAQGGAYRYRLLGIGVVVFLLTLGLVVWVLRRPARDQARP